MSKHTEATWGRDGNTVYALNRDGSNIFWASVSAGYVDETATRTSNDEILANATLMCAAPELLAALQDFALYFRSVQFDVREQREAYEQAVSVIAKATGEQS